MKKPHMILAILSTFVYLTHPLHVAAAPIVNVSGASPVIITEVQPGSPESASQEFIELYNATGQDIDLQARSWRLEIASSTAVDWSNPYRVVPLRGMLAAGQTYVIASEYKNADQTVRYLASVADVWFSPGLTASAGHIRLAYDTYTDGETGCRATTAVADVVEWSGTNGSNPVASSLDGRSLYVDNARSISNRFALQRVTTETGYVDTDTDMLDFMVAEPTPGEGWQPPVGSLPENPVVSPGDSCTPMPLPPLPPNEPSEPVETTPLPPENGSDGQEPEAGGEDMPSPPVNQGLYPVRISELLPNPGPPRLDSTDEYIELYNPNSEPFTLDGYMLEAGETTKRRYVFPTGTILAPQAYAAYYILQTGLSLSNDMGSVRLVDREGAEVFGTDTYAHAPEDKAWAYVAGTWQWTDMATPNALNILVTPPVVTSAKKTAVSTTTKKAAAVKAASTTKTPKTTSAKAEQPKQPVALAASTADARRPVHAAILVAIGGFAVLYGAYEYRHDLANRFHQLRSYRAHRRKARQISEGG